MSRLLRASIALVAAGLFLAACAETQLVMYAAKRIKQEQKSDEAPSGRYKVGEPYRIDGVYYYPAVDYDYDETGVASWYGPKFHGQRTANGELFDMNELTAAHRTLPMPSMVRVVNLDNGRSLVLRVNDRGPFARGRIIDVSRRAAQLLGFRYRGTARVRVEIMPEESRRLAALAGHSQVAEADQIASRPERRPVATVKLAPPSRSMPRARAVDAEPVALKINDAPTAPEVAAPDEASSSLMALALDVEPVRPTALYVQAGAFVEYANAAKVRAHLAGFAPAQVTEARVGSEKFFRVRLGPFQNLGRADRTLSRVAASGYPRARLIVE